MIARLAGNAAESGRKIPRSGLGYRRELTAAYSHDLFAVPLPYDCSRSSPQLGFHLPMALVSQGFVGSISRAFPTARLSFNQEEIRAIQGRPCEIFFMPPEPLQGTVELPRYLLVTCVFKPKSIQAL